MNIKTIKIRFEKFIDKTDNCWVWKGSKRDKCGYGWFWYDGKIRRAHRVSWIIYNQDIPQGLLVLHRCDNPPCVNPCHLFLGTHADNLADAKAKGRLNLLGEGNPMARLTDACVIQIKKIIIFGNIKYSEIAKMYDVSPTTIEDIANNRTWKHINLTGTAAALLIESASSN